MERNAATSGLEFHWMEYGDLVRGIGEEMALAVVAQYHSKPFSEIPSIREGNLLKAFLWAGGDKDTALLNSANVTFMSPVPPVLTEEEYSCPTDKGLTYMTEEATHSTSYRKGYTAWRARRNG